MIACKELSADGLAGLSRLLCSVCEKKGEEAPRCESRISSPYALYRVLLATV